MLIAEESLLVTTRPDGRPVASSIHDVGVAGAFLCELAQDGRVTVDERGRLHATDASPTDDPLLDLVLREFTARVGKKPKTVLPKVAKDLPTAAYHRLAEHGLVSRQERRAMWVFPQVSWPVVAGAQAAVAASVTVIAAVGAASS
ncbi:MAG: GPP34 family phosphoprotein [Actinobacteria bacterium]|nr:GPP34 family phosphoprotein [Actinomycetota bacterium]